MATANLYEAGVESSRHGPCAPDAVLNSGLIRMWSRFWRSLERDTAPNGEESGAADHEVGGEERMEVSLSPRARVVVAWLAVIVGGFILFEAAHALRPFAWAIITAYLFHPLVSWIHRKTRLPKQLITGWLYILVGLVVALILLNITPLLIDQIQEVQDQIPNAIDDIDRWFAQREGTRLGELGFESSFFQERLDEFGQDAANLLGASALPLVVTTFTVAIEIFIYLIATFYFIVYGDRFVQFFRDVLNRRYHREFDRLLLDINTTLGAYLRGQLILVFIMSVASYAALRILHVDYALTVAIATGFLELIPLIGPWSAGFIAVMVALFQDTTPFGWSHGTLALVVALAYFVLRQMEDAFVIPLVIGRIVHLHPLLVVFVLVVGTTLGGPLGLILAVPIAAVLKIIVAFFYAKLMARQTRRVEVIRTRADLERLADDFPDLVNATIVLLIEPNALDWNDLDFVRRVTDEALDHAIELSAVTPDGVAGSLTTAAGITTSTIPVAVPVTMEALAR